MLIVQRNQNQKIIVTHNGETLEILVTQIGNRKGVPSVKIGLTGPQSFHIVRDDAINPEPKPCN